MFPAYCIVSEHLFLPSLTLQGQIAIQKGCHQKVTAGEVQTASSCEGIVPLFIPYPPILQDATEDIKAGSGTVSPDT